MIAFAFMCGGIAMFIVLSVFRGASDKIYTSDDMRQTTDHFEKIIKELKNEKNKD